MIRKSADKIVDQKSQLFGGTGNVTIRHLLNGSEEMFAKGRTFAHSSLEPGCSIGYHVHNNESETYYIYSGTAEFNDNGEITTLSAGDVAFTGPGQGHSIKNIGNSTLHFIALILYE